MPDWISFWIFSNWVLLTTGPNWLFPFGSPTVTPAAASRATVIASSMRVFGTSMREGALQDCPEFGIIEATPRPTPFERVVVQHDVRALAAQFLRHALDG